MRFRLFALMAAFTVLAVLAIAGCSDDASTTSPSPDSTASPSSELTPLSSPDTDEATPTAVVCTIKGLVSDLRFDEGRSQFTVGESVSMTLSFTNCGDNQVRLFYSDDQRYEFIVEDAEDQEVWRWSIGKTFEQVQGDVTIQQGETVTYSETWDQNKQTGEPVEPGLYQIFGFNLGCGDSSATDCNFGPGFFIDITP